jgi:hypothetical protein
VNGQLISTIAMPTCREHEKATKGQKLRNFPAANTPMKRIVQSFAVFLCRAAAADIAFDHITQTRIVPQRA